MNRTLEVGDIVRRSKAYCDEYDHLNGQYIIEGKIVEYIEESRYCEVNWDTGRCYKMRKDGLRLVRKSND